MHSAAYVLLHALRDKMLQGTEYAKATMKTIRLRLIKVAAYVKEMKTRTDRKNNVNNPRKTVNNGGFYKKHNSWTDFFSDHVKKIIVSLPFEDEDLATPSPWHRFFAVIWVCE